MTKTPEQIAEEQEKERQEQERIEKELAAKEAKDRELAEAKEARIKAEAQLEAFKMMQDTRAAGQTTQQLSEEQWKQFEEQTGMTKQQLMAMDAIGRQHAERASKELSEKVKLAEERAARAEQELTGLKTERGADATKRKFFSDKPALSRYEAEINEFLADFPAEMKNDPEKLKGLLSKAETYVKGKLGDKYMRGNTNTGSAKFNRTADVDAEEGMEEVVNTDGLPAQSKRLVENLHGGTRTREEDFKKSYNGQGVVLSQKDEFEMAKKDMKGR